MKEQKQKTPQNGAARLRRLNVGMGLALLAIVALSVMVLRLYAASLQNRKDTMSNQSVSGTSTHTITFNLSGSNTFASGEQISVDFPETSAFTQSGTWTAADFAFADGTARVIDAVNVGPGITTVSCTNAANNVGVAFDTTNLIYRVIPCGALFTPSAAGAFVTFTISGQTPNGVLTNPPSTGAYNIFVLDGAGDCQAPGDNCAMGVTIVDNGQVNVTATVVGSPPPPPPPPPPDTTPPNISNITVTNITGTSATVNWNTDEISDSTVNYGLTATYGSQVNNPGLVASHSMNLTGLTDGTLYHFQVCSKDASNNQACSSDQTFTTTDSTPPIISNVQVTAITQTSATVTWTTNENATSFVDWQATTAGPPYANTSGNATQVTNHSVNLTGLTASTLYHFRVRSGDASSNESFTSDATFTTAAPPDTTPPVISNIQVTGITATAATVTWTTNEPSTSFVDYGTTVSYGSTAGNATLVTNHSVNLTGLTSQTLYHFRVRSADAATNEAASGDNTFTTLDNTPPVISNIQVTAITGTSATVSWTTNEQSTSFVDYGTTVSYGSTAGNATMVTSHSVNLTGLTSQTLYHFRVRSADASSNEAASSDQTFTTLDTTAPVISNVQSTGITTTAATITWTTNENSDSVVEYGTTISYGSTQSNASMVTSHTINLTGLTPATLYHFRVKSKDAANNTATSGDFTFTTQTPPDTTPPVISNIQVTNITSNSATVSWTTNEPATTFVDYGTTVSYGSTAGNATLVTNHSVNLTGLTSETLYHFRVRSADAASNNAQSSDQTFTTLDVNAPVISNVQVTNITETGATVSWTTNENATSFVDYGLTTSYGSTAGNATLVTSHSVNLTGLTRGTTYHFRVRSADADSNETSTTDATFATPDNTPPVISNIQVTNVTPTGARITWTTDENSDSVVEYGTTVSYGSTSSSATMVTSHQIDLTGLTPVTTYHFRVKSKDAANNTATSADGEFSTTTPAPPVISNVQVTNITQTSVTVTWTTDVSSDSKVDFGLTTSYGNTVADPAMVTSHSVNVTGLVKNRTYQFRVRSKDAYAQETASPNGSFTTAADTTPPSNVSPFTATAGNQSVSLSWGNPPDPDFDRVKIMRKTGSNPTGPSDGTEVYNGSGTSFVDTGLTNGTTYFYGAFAYDDVPNFASGAFANATPTGPLDTTPPANVSNFTATPGDQQIQLNWVNPTDPDFAGVRIVRKTTGFSSGPNDGVIVYESNGTSDLDTGLTNGTTYYYTAYAYDGPLNYASGAQASATPVPPPDTTPPSAVTNFKAVAGDKIVQLTWTNPTNPDWAGTRVVRKIGSDPTSPNDGTIVFDGQGDNKLDTGLVNDTEYHYAAYAYDPSLNFSAGAFATATPKAGAEPPPPPACTDSDGGKNYEVQGTVTTENGSSFQDVCTDPGTVRENYCDAATPKTESHACGEGFKCSAGRCTADVVTSEICGNGNCAGSENSINCAIDCPVAPTAPPVEPTTPNVPQQQRLTRDDFKFFATAGRLPLVVKADGGINVYTKMTMIVYLPDASIKKPIKSAFVNFAGSSTVMKQTASYEAAVSIPNDPGDYPLTVVVNYEDNTSDSVDFTVIASSRGLVYETIEGKDVPVANARVTLLVDNGGGFGVWDGGNTKQLNPVTTDDSGAYSFIVPPGTYKLKAEKEGYITRETLPFPIKDENVITTKLFITTSQIEETVEQLKDAISNPIVEEQAQKVAAPTAVAAAVANVASAGAATATAIPYLLYVWSFFAHPTLLIARRRRKKWGIVYNALTKLPLDLAIVRLLDAKTGRIVRSAVTDKDGRYFFIVQPGEYKMSAVKAGYVFPTAYLRGQKEDINFVDLYHGETIVVREETAITANIPLDPVSVEKTPVKIMLEGIGRRFQKSLGVLSILAMTIAVIITPNPIMFALLLGNVVLYFVFRRLAIPPKPKNWGIVYDESSGKPVQNVVARIFESKYNKLLETQVTDARGRYAFLVGNNVYYVTFEKPGYQKQQKGPIDLTKKLEKKTKAMGEAAQLVAVDVKLQPAAGGAKPPEKKSAIPPPPPPASPVTPVAETPPPVTPPAAPPAAPSVPAELAAVPEQKKSAIPPPPPPAAPAAQAKPAENKIPWEVQMLARLKAQKPSSDGSQTPPPAATPPAPTQPTPVQPPAPPAPPLPKPAASLTGAPESAMGEKKETPAPPATMSAPPVPPPAAAPPKPAGLVQDANRAHPEIKLIQDAAHAHPDEKPPEADKPPGPDQTQEKK